MQTKTKPFFHELSQAEIDSLVENGKTWKDVVSGYRQPEWCDYGAALDGFEGCWSLTDLEKGGSRSRISEEFCRGCESFKNPESPKL